VADPEQDGNEGNWRRIIVTAEALAALERAAVAAALEQAPDSGIAGLGRRRLAVQATTGGAARRTRRRRRDQSRRASPPLVSRERARPERALSDQE
jgi:hypothetical protein